MWEGETISFRCFCVVCICHYCYYNQNDCEKCSVVNTLYHHHSFTQQHIVCQMERCSQSSTVLSLLLTPWAMSHNALSKSVPIRQGFSILRQALIETLWSMHLIPSEEHIFYFFILWLSRFSQRNWTIAMTTNHWNRSKFSGKDLDAGSWWIYWEKKRHLLKLPCRFP